MQEDDIECESFTVISFDSLVVYENKYCLQVYLDNCAYKTANKEMIDYLDDNLYKCFENKININKGIDHNKDNSRKECMIATIFFNNGFKFHDFVCNGCHDSKMLCLNIKNIAIITFKNVYYFCVIHSISKFEANNLFKNSVLDDRQYI